MATLYAEKIMTDIILLVGNDEYPSHKLILCASSDVFQIMLHGSKWSESNEKRVTLGKNTSRYGRNISPSGASLGISILVFQYRSKNLIGAMQLFYRNLHEATTYIRRQNFMGACKNL